MNTEQLPTAAQLKASIVRNAIAFMASRESDPDKWDPENFWSIDEYPEIFDAFDWLSEFVIAFEAKHGPITRAQASRVSTVYA